MYPEYQNASTENLLKEVRELEDSYAEALADEVDAQSLSFIWHKIKILNREIDQRETLHRNNDRVRQGLP
jgi:hypothetical protein